MNSKILIAFVLLLAACDQRAADEVTLVYPTGTYVNWTNYEMFEMAFKLENDSLCVDCNYNTRIKKFVVWGREKADSFPEITKFLRLKLEDYKSLSRSIRASSCRKPTQVSIEYKRGKSIEVIPFKAIAECDIYKDSLPPIKEELWTLRRKYGQKLRKENK